MNLIVFFCIGSISWLLMFTNRRSGDLQSSWSFPMFWYQARRTGILLKQTLRTHRNRWVAIRFGCRRTSFSKPEIVKIKRESRQSYLSIARSQRDLENTHNFAFSGILTSFELAVTILSLILAVCGAQTINTSLFLDPTFIPAPKSMPISIS